MSRRPRTPSKRVARHEVRSVSLSAQAHVRTAVGSLTGSLQRSLLALIGIVVGIGSVIALLTIGGIVRNEAVKQFESLGADLLSVVNLADSRSRRRSGMVLDTVQARRLTQLPAINAASPYTLRSGKIPLRGEAGLSAQRVGVTPAFAELHGVQLAEGRFVSHFDGPRPFAVIGASIARTLREAGMMPEVGGRLRVDLDVYTLVGVLKAGARGPAAVRPDEAVLVPIEQAQRELGSKEVWGIALRMAPGESHLAATAEVEAYFARAAPSLAVRVDSPLWLIEQMDQQMRLFALLLGTVGGISLVVGGFGVMNAMLATVSERRPEVGIRRALGARRRDIQNQFLAESAVLCLAGGVLGALLGVGVALVVSALSDWTWQFSTVAVAVGVGTACALGLFFGYYPARKAAQLDPIAAIRDG